jgi:hypothetical protein
LILAFDSSDALMAHADKRRWVLMQSPDVSLKLFCAPSGRKMVAFAEYRRDPVTDGKILKIWRLKKYG